MSKELGVAFLAGLLPNCDANIIDLFDLSIGLEREIGPLSKEPISPTPLSTPACCRRACQRLPRLLRLQLFHR